MTTIGWFEVGTADAAESRRFYGELFGWRIAPDEQSPVPYDLFYADGENAVGGLADTGGELPSYAIFYVEVPDAEAAAERAESLGGKILVPPQSTPQGHRFAHILDPHGNHLGVITSPKG
ncbi:VOC family protein [Nocardioides speluncae]|uniref:VOC family protein n=1 Tax=Nocardioides speluncae TaxID=2670337 RepID=UPI000D68E53A|nr:VOC family protein [Nocardioides speluncae]